MDYAKIAFFAGSLAAGMMLNACKVEVTTTTDAPQPASAAKVEVTAAAPPAAAADTAPAKARVMTYNIQNYGMDDLSSDRPNRLVKLIADIKPTVVCLQEVENRESVERIFPPDQWLVIIDDDSDDTQDTAIAVKKPWTVNGVKPDLDADDENFLAIGQQNEPYFPNRRDALFVEVQSPDGKQKFTVIDIHAKARVGGRTNSDYRREGASRVLVEKIKNILAGRNVMLMGDFNDSPDDASLNILETGDPKAQGRIEDEPDKFMVNLTEPLWARGQVTEGANARRIDRKTGLINNVYPEARQRNDSSRGRDAATGPILIDNMLVNQAMAKHVVPNSTTIYLKPQALEGPGFNRPSDHLPVYVDIDFSQQ